MTDHNHDHRGACGHPSTDCKCDRGGSCRYDSADAARVCHNHRADTAVHSPEDARGPALRGTPATVRADGPLPSIRVTPPTGTARAAEATDDADARWLALGVDWRGQSR